jgi:hypothetical protein
VEGQLRVDLSKQFLEAVNEFTVPRQELRSAVHVRDLVDFVLLEPPSHAAGNGVGSVPGIHAIVQLNERVTKHYPLRWINRGDISTDSIS